MFDSISQIPESRIIFVCSPVDLCTKKTGVQVVRRIVQLLVHKLESLIVIIVVNSK